MRGSVNTQGSVRRGKAVRGASRRDINISPRGRSIGGSIHLYHNAGL